MFPGSYCSVISNAHWFCQELLMQASWLSFKPTHLFVFPYAYAAALILHWFGSLKIPIIPCGFVALLFHSPIRFFLYTKTHVFQCFQCIFHPNWFGTRLIYLLRVMWDSPGRGSRPQFHVLPISAHGTKAAMALRCRGLRGLQKKKNKPLLWKIETSWGPLLSWECRAAMFAKMQDKTARVPVFPSSN